MSVDRPGSTYPQRRSAPPTGLAASPSEAQSTGAGGAERGELAVDGASGGASDAATGKLTSWTEGRSPSGCVGPDATTERTTMFDMLHRHDVQTLLAAGVTQSRIRELTGISERTIRRIGAEPAVDCIDDLRVRRQRRVGRPSKTARFREMVKEWLADDPALKSV